MFLWRKVLPFFCVAVQIILSGGMDAEYDKASPSGAGPKTKRSCAVVPFTNQLEGFKFPLSKSMMYCITMGRLFKKMTGNS